MKKFLLTATMLVAFTALSKAQQGRVGINTSTPAATLDVVANAADTSRPDALLVPRLTRAELETKNTAYADATTTPSAQNGALVFVTGLGGNGTGKTVNVTAPGFYYYDGTAGNNVWKALGGGGTVSAPVSVRTSTTGNDFTAADLNGYVFLTGNTADFTAFPANAGNKGKTITVVRTGTQNITINGISSTSVNSIQVAGRGIAFVSDGTSWQSFSAQ
ncbi:hypothetical protein BBH99_03510 [Chryseobacterium contaminans]|uniref:Uncharacterized protein n=1 Tax=Chryseobacterium contaminans TaxID=1423959 RepID=A0A1M7EDW5_9FLAO|nr:hypothetical protein [Chryseobacterium contaminans]OCA69867.1 hypothetical protein BBH99_03510 [Chryseobacterium contaminans]SHL89981.1 hypothetical protein SAMN05444407_107145 [Chryseobacterium contaminans]